jgi:2-polyprenyl-3-methyl-5-hydroxy-6-metoxy-1,4-benzoquinol methylase
LKFPRDFTQSLHEYKLREFERIFGRCPSKVFDSVLELGAGPGFLSAMLAPLTQKLISTDIDISRVQAKGLTNTEFRACDAREIAREFPAGSFDLVCSSNMLEHVEQPERVVEGIHRVLRPNGITVHVMPSALWKLTSFALYVPNNAVRAVELLTQRKGMAAIRDKVANPVPDANAQAQRSKYARLFIPEIHGISMTHYRELQEFRLRKWVKFFEANGLEIRKIIKGPVVTGYAFGADRTRRLLEKAGLASVYGYVLTRKGEDSRYLQYFV